jgi:hypothetical protein
MSTSPRTSSRSGGRLFPGVRNRSGTFRMVRVLAVTSSPVSPSPRVAPISSIPSRYTSSMAAPSYLGSAM